MFIDKQIRVLLEVDVNFYVGKQPSKYWPSK